MTRCPWVCFGHMTGAEHKSYGTTELRGWGLGVYTKMEETPLYLMTLGRKFIGRLEYRRNEELATQSNKLGGWYSLQTYKYIRHTTTSMSLDPFDTWIRSKTV